MHYAFDAWMAREHPGIQFERYADDAVVHCVTEAQAKRLVVAIGNRMAEVGLRLHPTKTTSCTARTGDGEAPMSTPSSRSWGSRSEPAEREAEPGSTSPDSGPRSASTR